MFSFALVLPALMCLPGARSAEAPNILDSISKIWSSSKISVVPDTSQFGASSVLKAMARMPAPVKTGPASPAPQGACEKDYGQLCPAMFVNIGPVHGEEPHCTGASDYSGPCDGAFSFSGLSPIAKEQWSETCQAWWPCKECTRDFTEQCPQLWEPEGAMCKPTQAYRGPCTTHLDFGSYNQEMRQAWSASCGAFWSCLDVETSAAHGTVALAVRRPVSFLASKSIPVDGYKIRNSLYLTQPLREPEQASVNVIMSEDLPRMQEESKYRGMEDKAVQLKHQIRAMLTAMTAQ